jgi:hypothetical protein
MIGFENRADVGGNHSGSRKSVGRAVREDFLSGRYNGRIIKKVSTNVVDSTALVVGLLQSVNTKYRSKQRQLYRRGVWHRERE